jgi:hypothetical protein
VGKRAPHWASRTFSHRAWRPSEYIHSPCQSHAKARSPVIAPCFNRRASRNISLHCSHRDYLRSHRRAFSALNEHDHQVSNNHIFDRSNTFPGILNGFYMRSRHPRFTPQLCSSLMPIRPLLLKSEIQRSFIHSSPMLWVL